MKKIMNLFVLVAATAMALVSCQKNEIENPAPQEYEYTFLIGSADDAESKAYIGDENVVWEEDDRMGVYTKVAAGTISNNAYGAITPGTPATMKMYSNQAIATGDYIYAYYPYDESNKNGNLTVTLNIPTIQDGKDDMPMVAIPHCVESAISSGQQNAPVGKIKFANLGSVIEFHVYSTTEAYQTELVKSVTFNADMEIAGNFTFDMTAVDYSNEETLDIAGYEATSVVSTLSTSTQVSADKNAATVVKMVVAPGTYTGNIVVTTDKATYTYPISTAKEFNRSAVKPLGLNLRENVREENTSSEPVEVTATLTFDANKAHRTEYSTSKQVWEQNGLQFTNNKGDGNNIADYGNPVRLYKNSEIIISAPGNITKIEFNSATGDYFGALKDLLPNASVSGQIVTEVYDGSSNTVKYNLTTGQIRLNSLTVTYVGGDYVPPVLESISISGDYKTKFIQDEAFSFGAGVVTATYDDGSTRDVTNSAIFSGYNMSNVGNQTVTVEYEGVTTTYEITIEEKPVGAKSWKKVTDASTLKAGDVIRIGCDTKNTAAGSMGSQKYFASVSATFSNGVMTSDKAIDITLSGTTGAWILTTNEGTIGTSAAKALNKTGTGTKTWTISISNGNATIKSTTTSYGWIQYNASSPRFLNYASNQTAIQIYRYE